MSIKRKFLTVLILNPGLVIASDEDYADGQGVDDRLIRAVVKFAVNNPSYRAVAVLEHLKSNFDSDYIDQLQRDIGLFDEKIEIGVVLDGFRTQMKELLEQKKKSDILLLLQEKPFSALTAEEREMLKNLTAKKT